MGRWGAVEGRGGVAGRVRPPAGLPCRRRAARAPALLRGLEAGPGGRVGSAAALPGPPPHPVRTRCGPTGGAGAAEQRPAGDSVPGAPWRAAGGAGRGGVGGHAAEPPVRRRRRRRRRLCRGLPPAAVRLSVVARSGLLRRSPGRPGLIAEAAVGSAAQIRVGVGVAHGPVADADGSMVCFSRGRGGEFDLDIFPLPIQHEYRL